MSGMTPQAEIFEQIRQLMGQAEELDWDAVPAAQRRELVAESARCAAAQAAMDAVVVAAYEASAEWAADGHRTTAAGVRAECNQSRATARRRVTHARKLRDLDHVRGALAAGEITTDAAEVLLRADRAATHDALVAAEKELVDAARHLEHHELVAHVRAWCDLVDPDQADERAGDRDAERSVHASKTLGGQVRVDGWLTPVEGAEVLAELERLEQQLFEADWAEARHRLGEKATTEDLRRTAAQRRHDALVEMARRSANWTGDGGPAARGRAVVNVLIDYETFIAELARHTGQPYTYPTERTCQLDDETAIAPADALNLALAGEVRRVVFGADGHILDFGRSRRLFTRALADAIAIRDRRCTHPGCLLPAGRCQTDHRIEWHNGGETSETNGETLCRYHNLWKTNHPRRWHQLRHRTRRRPRAG